MPASKKSKLPSPWVEVLEELDVLLREQVEVHCIGGFVASLFYGLPRPTGDVDFISVLPPYCVNDLQAIAGPGSVLEKKYKVHMHHVTVNAMPEDYEARLVEMFPSRFKNLRLCAPDPYDLILSKLERNSTKDRDDVEYLAKILHLNPQTLRERYQSELRPYLTNETRYDLTLKLWTESCFRT